MNDVSGRGYGGEFPAIKEHVMARAELTLTDFLLARIDEDEAAARGAEIVIGDDLTTYKIGEWWEKPEHGRVYAGHWHRVVDGGGAAGQRDFANTAALPHIARHDPARVLARCKADREIVGLHVEDERVCQWDRDCDQPVYTHDDDPAWLYPCPTLRALATIYADHPDFRAEWAL